MKKVKKTQNRQYRTRNQMWRITTVGSNPTLSAGKFKPRRFFLRAFFVGKIGAEWDFGSISAREPWQFSSTTSVAWQTCRQILQTNGSREGRKIAGLRGLVCKTCRQMQTNFADKWKSGRQENRGFARTCLQNMQTNADKFCRQKRKKPRQHWLRGVYH